MVKLTEECSVAILKKKGSECPTISHSTGSQHFENALCDLGASVTVMPKVVFDKLNYTSFPSTTMCLQLADQSVR
jgi:predicted aspartyl protease